MHTNLPGKRDLEKTEYSIRGCYSGGVTGTLVLAVPEHDLALLLLTNRQNRGVDEDGLYPDVDPLQRAVVAAVMEGVQNAP